MPDINGLELVRFVRQSERHREIPLLIISTQTSERDKERALALGANSFLAKPFTPEALREVVTQSLAGAPRERTTPPPGAYPDGRRRRSGAGGVPLRSAGDRGGAGARSPRARRGAAGARLDPSLINDVFRAVHTLKGLAGLFGATRMASLSHELEELLDKLRLGKTDLTAGVLDLLFRSVQLYGLILQAEKEGRDQAIPQVDELVRELNRNAGGSTAAVMSSSRYELDPSLLAVLTEYEEHRLRANIAQGLRLYRLRVQFQLATIDQALDELKGMAKPHGEIITYLPTGAGADADSIELDILMASSATVEDLRLALANGGIDLEEIPRRNSPTNLPGPVDSVRIPLNMSMPPPSGIGIPSLSPTSRHDDIAPGSKGGDLGTLRSVAQTVRVDIHKLDRLMNIVGELSIVRTSMARLVERLRAERIERELAADVHRLQRTFERHLGAMQQGILEVRMVPLGQVFDKLARVVRQISREADKLVNLVITGAETEVDKLIVEELSDPLMHMMRNAIDHGIETRSEREAVGKPALGTIALNAFQKGNHVVIEIEDDGGGIDTTRLLDASVRRGVISAEDARAISRAEILNLIFIPGVSTRASSARSPAAAWGWTSSRRTSASSAG